MTSTEEKTMDLESFVEVPATASVVDAAPSPETPSTLEALTKLMTQLAGNLNTLTQKVDALTERPSTTPAVPSGSPRPISGSPLGSSPGAGMPGSSDAITSRAERVLEFDSETQTAKTLSGKGGSASSPAPLSEAVPWQKENGDPWTRPDGQAAVKTEYVVIVPTALDEAAAEVSQGTAAEALLDRQEGWSPDEWAKWFQDWEARTQDVRVE